MPTMAELASEGLSGPEEAGRPVEACTGNEGPAGPANGSVRAEPASCKRDGRAKGAQYCPDGPGEMGKCPAGACGRLCWPVARGYTTSSMIRLLGRAAAD